MSTLIQPPEFFQDLENGPEELGPEQDKQIPQWSEAEERFVMIDLPKPIERKFGIVSVGGNGGSSGTSTIAGATDFTDTTGPATDGYSITWDNGTGKFVLRAPITNTTTIADATDFTDTTGSGTNGYSITWDNGAGKFVLTEIVASPGGSDTQVQYNDGGVFGGDAGLIYDDTDNELSVSGRVVTPIFRPVSDSATAVKIQNAAGTEDVFLVDTESRRVAINRTPSNAPLTLAQTSHSNGMRIYGFDTQSAEFFGLALNSSGTGTFSTTSSMSFSHAGLLTFSGTGDSDVRFNGSGGGRTLTLKHSAHSVAVGGGTNPSAYLDIQASTTSRASMRIRDGSAPTSPDNGDVWQDGSNIVVRIGGTTYTLDMTAV